MVQEYMLIIVKVLLCNHCGDCLCSLSPSLLTSVPIFLSLGIIITSSTSPITNTTQTSSLISIRKTVGNQKLPAVVRRMEAVMENNASCGWVCRPGMGGDGADTFMRSSRT